MQLHILTTQVCIVAASTLSSLVVVCYSSLSGVICIHEILEEVVIGHALLMQHYKLLYKRHFPLSSFGYVDNVKLPLFHHADIHSA